jgi:hypothetical protein
MEVSTDHPFDVGMAANRDLKLGCPFQQTYAIHVSDHGFERRMVHGHHNRLVVIRLQLCDQPV